MLLPVQQNLLFANMTSRSWSGLRLSIGHSDASSNRTRKSRYQRVAWRPQCASTKEKGNRRSSGQLMFLKICVRISFEHFRFLPLSKCLSGLICRYPYNRYRFLLPGSGNKNPNHTSLGLMLVRSGPQTVGTLCFTWMLRQSLPLSQLSPDYEFKLRTVGLHTEKFRRIACV